MVMNNCRCLLLASCISHFASRILHLASCILLLASCFLLVACDDEDIERRYTDYRTDIVTYQGDDGGGAQFELLRRDDSTSVMLLSNVRLDKVKQGQRVLLRYDWANTGETGGIRHILAYGVGAIVSDSLRYTVKPLAEYLGQMEPIKLLSIWRTGGYVNLRCQAEYTGKSRHFYLLLDSATVKQDTVHCYLVNNTHGDTTYHWREAYASFYVGNAWNSPNCRTMRIHINDEAHGGMTTYDFNKSRAS